MHKLTNEEIYNNYFKDLNDTENASQAIISGNQKVFKNSDAARVHVTESAIGTDHEVSYYNKADGNISNVEDIARILKELCNAAWGDDWGELSLDIKTGENSANIVLPQILIDINTRDITEGFPLKPMLMDVQIEKDSTGKETGESYLMYRQWFDANIEFDIFARNNKECRELLQRFEQLIMVYSGYLKRKGLAEIFFLREISPKSSLNYSENVPMRCILYYVRFESVTPIRISTINTINAKIGANQVTSTKVTTLLQESKENKRDMIELDFFDGDNGITYQ
jgi:hypothetical protein